MTSGYWLIVIAAGGVIVVAGCFWLYGRLAYRDGYEAGRLDERSIHHQRARQAAPPPTRLLVEPAAFGRHAPWEPRLTVARTGALPHGGPSSLTAPLMHRPTDSSELRALVAGTDRYIETMRRDESAWRGQLATR